MPRGHMKYRHLSRKSSHRVALLRNMVTSLVEHESIRTTWHKAKEVQRQADKLITLAKRNTAASKIRAIQILFNPHDYLPKLFGTLRERYANRPGGYTRVLRIEPLKEDQAASAILEFVDSPKDTRFAMTARTIAYQQLRAPQQGKKTKKVTEEDDEYWDEKKDEGLTDAVGYANPAVPARHRSVVPASTSASIAIDRDGLNDATRLNVSKVTRYRPSGESELSAMVDKFKDLLKQERDGGVPEPWRQRVYREDWMGKKASRHKRQWGVNKGKGWDDVGRWARDYEDN